MWPRTKVSVFKGFENKSSEVQTLTKNIELLGEPFFKMKFYFAFIEANSPSKEITMDRRGDGNETTPSQQRAASHRDIVSCQHKKADHC